MTNYVKNYQVSKERAALLDILTRGPVENVIILEYKPGFAKTASGRLPHLFGLRGSVN